MVTASDFIHLPYTSDLTQAGIAYACRSLPHTFNRMGGSRLERLRRIVAGVAVELALRRYLTAQGVPHDTLGATPFTEPDRYDVALGGRRCDVKSYQIFQKEEIRLLRKDPARLLHASALVPSDQLTSQHLADTDLYIFAFVTALLAQTQTELERAVNAGLPVYRIHPMPEEWTQPAVWASLGRISLKTESQKPVTVEIGGQGKGGEFQTEEIELQPLSRTQTTGNFYSLAYLHVAGSPGGRVGIHSSSLGKTHLIYPTEWGNIWIYGMEIILTGYMTRSGFRRRAQPLPAGSRVLQYAQTRTENMALPIAELNPLSDLFRRAREWHAGNL